jgi:hypothetical protein
VAFAWAGLSAGCQARIAFVVLRLTVGSYVTKVAWGFPATPSASKDVLSHVKRGILYNLDPFVLGSLIPDDGGSTHL